MELKLNLLALYFYKLLNLIQHLSQKSAAAAIMIAATLLLGLVAAVTRAVVAPSLFDVLVINRLLFYLISSPK